MANTSHYQQYSEERIVRWEMGKNGELPAIQEVCRQLATSLNVNVGFIRYDESWFQSLDMSVEEWIKGVSDYIINVYNCGGLYAEVKIKDKGVFRKTKTGGTTQQGSVIPMYGCESFYLDIYPVYDHVMSFTRAFNINPESFLFFFVLLSTKNIYVISIAEIGNLIQNGYKGIPLCIYGEGYGTLDDYGNPAVTYLIPVDATHHIGVADYEYFKGKFVNKIMFPVDVLKQENVFQYEYPQTSVSMDAVNVAPPLQLFIGNRTNNSYHYPDCKWAPVRADKRVEFHSRQEAIDNGFIYPCSDCGSDKNKM